MVSISRPKPSSYAAGEKTRAAAWKAATTTLPPAAKVLAPYVDKDGKPSEREYDHCLPAAFADLSLLPEVRTEAIELFAELAIPWHAGVGHGPSNNLVSSQVQCVNALGQMVTHPERIVRAFAAPLGTVEVIPIEADRYLTFEYVGPTDYFGEAPHGERTRGAKCTSVDAAFVHRNAVGQVELILIEWKYTETYGCRRPDPGRDTVRRRRYHATFDDPDGPLRSELLDLDVLFQEPLYQLIRQQLLAYRLEQAGAHGAQRARVVHVLPPANVGYQASLHGAAAKALGATVAEVWSKLLRRPDRFASLDPEVFLDPAITSEEYVNRYGRQS
ncbi:MAG: PGN_0703 family putative restriction endonuclease [Acidimicrobiales bacterium]